MPTLHERIARAAYPLFAERGLRDVTAIEIQEAAGVTEEELAAVFPSRNAVAAACLVQREREWTIAVVEAGARARGANPEERLLAVFDVLEEWFQSDEEEATTFLDVLIGLGPAYRDGRNGQPHLANVRSVIASLAVEADLIDPERFALSFHVLMKGSILSAVEGDTVTGVRAKDMGRDLIARHRRPRTQDADRASTWFGDPSFDLYEAAPRQRQRDTRTDVLDWYDSGGME